MTSPERRLFVSFSGGATSAYMAWACTHVHAIRHRYDDVRVVFANTGLEHPRTLDFVRDCSAHFGLDCVWIEADVRHGERASSRSRVVTYGTASRNGEPFEEMIRKYGIPNPKFPHCTRELKVRPLHHYLRSIGWGPGTYDTAIGIRIDEIDRMAHDMDKRRIVYPLVSWLPMTKGQIAAWWDAMPFRLGLPEHLGNCVTCFKKSARKLALLAEESPAAFDFAARMERDYGRVGPEFAKSTADPSYRRVFFRGNRGARDIVALNVGVNEPGPCDESCEVHS